MAIRIYSSLLAISFGLMFVSSLLAESTLAEAEELLLTGRYAEAEAAFAKLGKDDRVAAALGASRALSEQGKFDLAAAGLQTALKENPQAASLSAELASIAFQRGQYEQSTKWCGQALKQEPDQLLARWIQAELQRTSGGLIFSSSSADAVAIAKQADRMNKLNRQTDDRAGDFTI